MRVPFFSIVIPVYNAGKYLDDCLLSIKNNHLHRGNVYVLMMAQLILAWIY